MERLPLIYPLGVLLPQKIHCCLKILKYNNIIVIINNNVITK